MTVTTPTWAATTSSAVTPTAPASEPLPNSRPLATRSPSNPSPHDGDSPFRMRPEVQVLPGPPPTMTSGNVRRRVRVHWAWRMPDQELLPGYRSWSWTCWLGIRTVHACHPDENGPSGSSTICGWPRSADLAAQLTQEIKTPMVEDVSAVAFGPQAASRPCPAGPTGGEYG